MSRKMSSSSPWDAYPQHTGLPPSLESYAHPFASDMRSLAGSSLSAGMSALTGEGMLNYPKSGDLSAANSSPYAAYGQSYPGVTDLSFSGSLRSHSAAHSTTSASENLPASSPHGQFSSTPTSENQNPSPPFSSSSSLYTSSAAASTISSNPYAQGFPGCGSSADMTSRGPFSPFAQPYGYSMYGYNQMGGFPSPGSLDGVNRYMGGISSSSLMQSSAMGLYSSGQPFAYHPTMGWGPAIPGFSLKEGPDLMSQEELERYRYRQLSSPYFSGLPTGGSPVRSFPSQALQPGLIRTPPFMDDRSHSPAPKKSKKSTEEAERPPTPAPRDPASFHSHRGIYLFSSNVEPGCPNFFADRYVLFEKELCEKMSRVSLPGKIQYVYNPLEYAFESHLKFVRRFCTGEKYILFVGMNPGPFGMSQNGVPFGECAIVKEWLHIDGEVLKPVLEHPKRRVVGLECTRSEVTGGRFWQLFRTLCHTPEHFFRTSFVHNLCPFAFLTDSGKNVTPPQLTSSVLDQINVLCNATLVDVVRLLKSKYVVCIGKYALAQAQKALSADEFNGITLECLMHPSPINPAANKGWADIAIKQLTEIGIIDIIRYGRIPYQPPAQPAVSQQSHSSSALNQHSQSKSFQKKQSPSRYGFQSPPSQAFHSSTQGSSNHQSPARTPSLKRSPSQSSSCSQSPIQDSTHCKLSPAHSPDSLSPAPRLCLAKNSPTQATGGSCSSLPSGHGDPSKDIKAEKVGNDGNHIKDPASLDTTVKCEVPEDLQLQHQLSGNTLPSYGYAGTPGQHDSSLDNTRGDSSSQGSDTSKENSPSMMYTSSDTPGNTAESQMRAQNAHMMDPQQMSNSFPMGASNQQLHHRMSSGHHHLDMGLSMGSPGLDQAHASEQGLGSSQMKAHLGAHNSHLSPMSAHMASSFGPMHSQMSGSAGFQGMGMQDMSSLHSYGHMGNYSPSMSLNNYAGAAGAGPNSEMSGYGHQVGLHNIAASAMHGGRHMGIFNHYMNPMMAAPDHSPMHHGVNSLYDSQNAKEFNSHYLEKPPECS